MLSLSAGFFFAPTDDGPACSVSTERDPDSCPLISTSLASGGITEGMGEKIPSSLIVASHTWEDSSSFGEKALGLINMFPFELKI